MTAMQWTVFALLLIIALLALAVIYLADRRGSAEQDGAHFMSARQRRKLRRMRADLARARTVRR